LILIADDEPGRIEPYREDLEYSLRGMIRVEAVEGVRRCLERIRDEHSRLACVVMDVLMAPEGLENTVGGTRTGIRAFEYIRAFESKRGLDHVPIVFLTNLGTEPLVGVVTSDSRCLALSKPDTLPIDLRRAVDRLLVERGR